jgi:hypothetical protein
MFHAQYLQGKFGSYGTTFQTNVAIWGVNDQSQSRIIKAHVNQYDWIALAHEARVPK